MGEICEDRVSLGRFSSDLRYSYDEVRDNDLENLRLQAGPASERLLQE